MAEKTKKSELSFERAITRLEEIVRLLESGDAPLDKSLTLFEEGITLVKLCNAKLDGAQQKVSLLCSDTGGTELTEEDFHAE